MIRGEFHRHDISRDASTVRRSDCGLFGRYVYILNGKHALGIGGSIDAAETIISCALR